MTKLCEEIISSLEIEQLPSTEEGAIGFLTVAAEAKS
jgi:hypothetical protein